MMADKDKLRLIWSDPDSRIIFLTQLEKRSCDQDKLNDIRQLVDASDSDLFDVLAYVLMQASR